jgi:hypothetical protein
MFCVPFFTVCLPDMHINKIIFMQTGVVSLATRTSPSFSDKILREKLPISTANIDD